MMTLSLLWLHHDNVTQNQLHLTSLWQEGTKHELADRITKLQ
jgi:hypothetical protein